MQALTNAATVPSTAASGAFVSCATETTTKVVQTAFIKPTDAAVHLIYYELNILLFICVSWIIFTLSNYGSHSRLFSINNGETRGPSGPEITHLD